MTGQIIDDLYFSDRSAGCPSEGELPMPDQPFWIDREYDREYASDGVSRYGAYVRQATFKPWTDEGQHVELAVYAWDRATTPVMSPGYVRQHPGILSAQLARSDWDGSLIAQVDILTGQPQQFRNGLPGPGDGWWRSWPSEHCIASDREIYYEPGGEDLARSAYLLASVSLRFPIPSGDLPYASAYPQLAYAADEAVTVVVRELNRIVGPVLRRVEEG